MQIIREFTHTFPIPIKVIEASGANIARGRNIAIQHADFPIIACTDLGCTLNPEWLKNLIAPFEHDSRIELSARYYQVIPRKTLDRLCSHFFGIDLRSVKPEEFLPSSRSLAMKKSFWAKAGGYPEWLTDAGEDTLFDYAIKSQKARWAFVPQTRVYWKAPGSARRTQSETYCPIGCSGAIDLSIEKGAGIHTPEPGLGIHPPLVTFATQVENLMAHMI